MAEPVWNALAGGRWTPECEVSEETAEESVLLRWAKDSEGRMTLLELPLTPELYLDPQLGDTMAQGDWHDVICREITDILAAHFKPQPDVLVIHDVKHKLLPRRPGPAPDVSVIRGVRHRRKRSSFNVAREGVRPCLVVEVVSPMNAEVRQTDLVGKVALYQDAGIPEYVIVDSPGKGLDSPFELLGYRLDAGGRYRPIEPDAAGCLLSTTTGIWFQVSPDGQRVFLFEQSSGRRLLNLSEEMDLRKVAEQETRFEAKARRAAEERAAREAAARKAAEVAREVAEEKAAREAAARKVADEKAAREIAAREAAEEKAARVEADMARLRGELDRLRRNRPPS